MQASLRRCSTSVGGCGIDTIRSWITNVKETFTARDSLAGRSDSRSGFGEIIDLAFQGPNSAMY